MKTQAISSPNAHDLKSGYAQAVCVTNANRIVYVSGQIPTRIDGSVPEMFEDQARQVWSNIGVQLEELGMSLSNIVKHTTFLSDRRYRQLNSKIRREMLGENKAALTVIIAEIFDEAWLLEIEAIAVD